MAVAIKRVIQFSHAKMNSVQSEQTRLRAKNKYKNDHIKEEFKKYNLHPVDNTEGLTYNQYFKKYCKRRSGGKKKAEVVSEMGKDDFYLDKLYTGKGGGRTTCCVESMVISLNDRIDATPEAVLAYQADPKNQKKMQDFVKYIMETDERFKYCRFLNVDWHFDEVYTPYERKEPTEEYPEGEIVVGTPKISIHGHITYIPLTKEVDASGKEYLSLNRGAVWKSRTAAYNQSYSQFNDDIYGAVEKELGYERGKLYPASEKDRNEDMNIQDWIIVHNGEMEKQYKEQERLKLLTEEERTKIREKDFGKVHQQKKEAAQAELNKLVNLQKEEEEIIDILTQQEKILDRQVKYKNNLQAEISKKITEKQAELDEIKRINDEANRQMEISMQDLEETKKHNAEELRKLRKIFEEEKEKLSENILEYEAWKEVYLTDENGEFIERDGKLFLTPKAQKIIRDIQIEQIGDLSNTDIENVIEHFDNAEILEYVNTYFRDDLRQQILDKGRAKKYGIPEQEEYIDDQIINDRLER